MHMATRGIVISTAQPLCTSSLFLSRSFVVVGQIVLWCFVVVGDIDVWVVLVLGEAAGNKQLMLADLIIWSSDEVCVMPCGCNNKYRRTMYCVSLNTSGWQEATRQHFSV